MKSKWHNWVQTKGQIKNITQNELASSYSSVYLIREIATQILLFLENSNDINEETIKKYKDLETSSKDYLDKNLLKLNNMIQDGVKISSIEEFKKIITQEKYPTASGKLAVNSFALNLVKLVKSVNNSLKDCYEDKTISKIILDSLGNFYTEIEKLLEEKKELNDKDDKKQFKRDFVFIKNNIDKEIDEIDFKAFKKKIVSLYKKFLPKEKGD